jgi:multidrug efflux pump
MNISRFCIDHPIFASVISIIITLAGAVAMLASPVAQYPDITPPQITVSATYPGADADVVANNVAAPIEQQVNGADGMIYMNSSSSATGNLTLNVFFEIGRDPELAQVDVQNRVNLALPQLPSAVTAQGVQVQKKSSAFMMVIAIYSPGERYDPVYVANYANIYVLDALKRIPGANQTAIFGTPDYAMRVWLKPDRMAQLGVTAAEVQDAVAAQNQQYAVGRLGQSPTGKPVEQAFTVTSAGRMTDPSQFDNIIIRAASGGAAIVRLKDIGHAELGQKDYSIRGTFQGKPATMMAVYQQPGANALDVSNQVKATLAAMKKDFPEGVEYKVVMDTTNFTRASIHDVVKTFFEAVILVVLVVYLFLQSLRATLIPVLAVPVSIVGTFIGMKALGFSINMLTLFGMVLAIGIVVDDAIVVIENVERNMTVHKLDPKEASRRAMDEVAGPVVAIVLVLCAVFVPVAFLGGITGQLYKQFAITIVISVIISGLVALTLSPALAAILLKPGHHKNRFFRWFDRQFERMTNGYSRGVAFTIKRSVIALLVFAGMIALSVVMIKKVPAAFLPPEDQGYLLGAVIMPDSASLDRTGKVGARVSDYFMKDPAVEGVAVIDGYSLLDNQNKNNAGTFFVGFKDFSERYTGANIQSQNARSVLQKASQALGGDPRGMILPVNPPSIPGLGTTGGLEVWVQSKGDKGVQQLASTVNDYLAQAKKAPELSRVTATFNASSQQMRVDVDREKAETLGVPVQDVYGTLQTMFGSLYVSQFIKSSRLWQVILQAEPQYRLVPEDLGRLYVRNRDNRMLPLSSVVSSRYVVGPDLMTRFNNFPAVKITANPAPGYSSGQAIAALERIGAQALPSDYALAWSGEAFEEKQSGSTSASVFAFGLVMVFLILAAQYEKWSLPVGVLMAVPFALFGALAAVMMRGLNNDVYFQIGLTMLVALAAKNAILIFEFAVLNREQGKSFYDAATIAARERLRPIVMTSLAFILGCVPLAIAKGASANSRISIGTGVIGGMLAATVIAVFFIPMFYYVIEHTGERFGRKKAAAPEPGHEPEHEHRAPATGGLAGQLPQAPREGE